MKKMTPREMLNARMKKEGFAPTTTPMVGNGDLEHQIPLSKLKQVVEMGPEQAPMVIEGAGGKGGGGGRAAVEADNTLQSIPLVRVLELISEGEIEGVVGGLKGVYLNDTPVQNEDDSYNFQNVSYAERFGLPSQPYMDGFPSAEAEVQVGVEVKASTPSVKTVSSNLIDAARVTIYLPQGMSLQDTKTGDLNGHSVTIAIDVKPTNSGTWTQAGTDLMIAGKTTRPYEKQYYIKRPVGSGTWDIRVRRISPDPANSAEKNQTTFSRITEIQDVKLEYPHCAYVGIAVDAASVGGAIPRRAYRVRGIKMQVPSNWDPYTRAYDGAWDGTFKTAWSDNPAWCLYDMLTNTRKDENGNEVGYGMGIDPNMIDKFSFYAAAKYSDELVPDGKGGQEPRFTFNTPIVIRAEAIKLLQNMAGAMRGTLLYSGGLISINQDRPSNPVKLVTNANVIGGAFTRKSSALSDRNTVVNMTWNDKNNRYLPTVSTIEDQAGIDRYGYNVMETASYGATTEGQAIRNAKWILDTNLNQTQVITYKSSLAQFDLKIGDVIKVFDQNYTNNVGSGRIVSATANSVTLDRPVTILANATLDVTVPNSSGIQFVTKTVTNAPGTYTTLNVSTPFTQVPVPSADFIVASAVSPQLFRVWKVTQEIANIITVEALEYDPNKYARIELGINVPGPVFTDPEANVIGNPQNLEVTSTSSVTAERVTRGLLLAWDQPLNGVPLSYNVKVRYNNGPWKMTTGITTRSFEVLNVDAGKFDFVVYAQAVTGSQSSGAQISYTLDLEGGSGSALLGVTGLTVVGGGVSFVGEDLNVQWTNPVGNNLAPVPLKDFEVRVINPVNDAVLRTEYVPAVAGGSKATYAYTFAKNMADAGPRRSVKLVVYARDTDNKTSVPTTVTFNNPAPAVVNNFVATGMIKGMQLTYDKPTESDFVGVMVWQGTTSNFALTQSSCVFDGNTNLVSINNLADNVTYYYRIAGYDTFGKSYTGAGLNVSGTISAVAAAMPGTPSGPTLPTTGQKDGDFFYNTTDKHLYTYDAGQAKWVMVGNRRGTKAEMDAYPTAGLAIGEMWFNTTDNRMYNWNGTKWVAAGIASGTTLPVTGAIGDAFFNTTDNKLYVWNGTKWVTPGVQSGTALPTSASTGDLFFNTTDGFIYSWNGTKWAVEGSRTGTTAQRAALSISLLTVGDTFWDTTIGGMFRWDGTQWISLKVNTVDLSGTISAVQIAAGAVDATKTNIAAIDAATGGLKAGTVNSAQIVKDAVTSVQLAANAVTAAKTQIAAIDPNSGNLTVNSVSANNIVGGTITGNKIYSGTVEANKIVGSQLQADTIGAREIAAGSITAVEIAGRTITAENILAGTITANEIKAATITGDKIYGNTINANGVYTGTLSANQITTGTIDASKISVTNLSANSITSGTIGAGVIYGGTMSANNLTAGTINGNTVSVINLSASSITTGSFSGDRITAGTMNANRLGSGTIDAGVITVTNLNATNINTGFMSGLRISANTIQGDRLVANTVTADKINTYGLSIKDPSGNIILQSGVSTGIDYSKISGSKPPANADVTSLNTAKAIANQGIFATANQLQGWNINTYIAGAAIGTALIANAAIGNAQIANLSVDTLKIKDNSVTVPVVIAGNGNHRMIDRNNRPGYSPGMIQVAERWVTYPATTQVSIMCFWKATPDAKNGSNSRIHVTVNGSWELAASNSNMPGYVFAQTAAGTTTIGPGTHKIEVWFGNDWGNNHWFLEDFQIILMGTMK